jgi:glycosyltransferase involved in cell wall biosynthesis
VLDRILRDASAIHVLSSVEENACREFGITSPIWIIPNGLPTSDFEKERSPDMATGLWPQLKGRRVLLYLGRLCAEKGLGDLVEVWSRLRDLDNAYVCDWVLVIAGPDYRGYESRLWRLIRERELDDRVVVTGAVSGSAKDSLLASAECLVLPSYGEAFSMTLLDAMAAGTPVIYSSECHFPELSLCGGGWEVPVGSIALLAAMSQVIRLPSSTLKEIGRKGWLYGYQRYTIERVAGSLLEMYRSVQ